MGLSGIVSQIILLRELLVSFSGNELIIGIILANWMILEALGSFAIGKSVERTKRRFELYILFQLFFSIALPICIFLSRVFKNALLASPGEAVGFTAIYFSSFLILMPVALPHGALFTYGCRNYSQEAEGDASSIGRVYFLETMGSIVGGLLLSFYLIKHFNSFEIAFGISLTNAVISMLLLWPEAGHQPLPIRKGLLGLSCLLTVLFLTFMLSPLARNIHLSSIRMQWTGLQVIHNENSIYGNITVTKRGEQFTFFTDGIPSITTPVPDIASIEDLVHFSMLLHEKPRSALILSGGAGGMINEILKYPVTSVDYVELDPLLLKLLGKFSTPLTRSELSDKRVNIHYTDGRFFLKRVIHGYDVIFIGLAAPVELQTNRLFSLESFFVAKEKMNQNGILALTLPGSLTYIGPELRDLNGCIQDTLERVFKYVRVIPGETNLYFASDSGMLMDVDATEMVKRLEERKIKANLFTRAYIEYRLHERWLRWFNQAMERNEIHINSDFRPLGVFFNLSYWNALFSPYLSGIFQLAEGLSLKLAIGVVAGFALLFTILFKVRPKASILALPYAIATSGFGGMIFDLSIIFTFQTLYGYLYYQIGLLVTTFMVGVAAGSFFIIRRLDRIKKDTLVFLITELCFICFALFLPFVFLIPSRYIEKQLIYVLIYAIFLTMSFLSGVLVGLQFPVATKIHLSISPKGGSLGHTAGLLYGADLFGGYLGGLLGGVILLPILGLRESCLIVAIIKGSSFLLFLLFTKMRH